jgi:hypothetical protein
MNKVGFRFYFDKINISLGFDYGYRLWDDLAYGYTEVESEDKVTKFYVGIDYLF